LILPGNTCYYYTLFKNQKGITMNKLIITATAILSIFIFNAGVFSQSRTPIPPPPDGGMKMDGMKVDDMKMDQMKVDGMKMDSQKMDEMTMD